LGEWYRLSWNKVVEKIGTSEIYGLSSGDIGDKRKIYGSNEIKVVNPKNFWKLSLKILFNSWGIVFILLSFYSFYKNDLIAGGISTVIFLAIIAFILKDEINEKNNYKIFNKYNDNEIWVLRDGVDIKISAKDVVVGDILLLRKGDMCPADARIISSEKLRVKETLLTGENELVEKYHTRIDEEVFTLSEIKNCLFKGSFIIAGEVTAVAVAVGDATQMGSILTHLNSSTEESERFFKGIFDATNIIAQITLALAIIEVIISFIRTKDIFGVTANTLYSYAQPLLLCVFLLWFLYDRHLKKDNVHMSRLSSLLKLTSVDAMIIDKVGFLTEDFAIALQYYSDDEFHQHFTRKDDDYNQMRLIEIGVICNNAKISNIEDELKLNGSLYDVALIRLCKKLRIDWEEIQFRGPRVFYIPYDNGKKIDTSVDRIENNCRAHTKGSVDEILKRCRFIMKKGIEVEITPKDINEIKLHSAKMAANNLEVIAFAYRNFNYQPTVEENIESNLVFVGIIGFENPEKPYLDYQLEQGEIAGIEPIVVCDNNKLSAFSFAKSVGLATSVDQVVSGVELENSDEGEFQRVIEKTKVYCKINHNQKHSIVKILKGVGSNIAVTGSDLADIPAFQEGNVSLSVGNNCSFIAKKLSDGFIGENSYSKIIDLIISSKKVLCSLQKLFLIAFYITISNTLFNFIANMVLGIKFPSAAIFFLGIFYYLYLCIKLIRNYSSAEIINHKKYGIDKGLFSNENTIRIISYSVVSVLSPTLTMFLISADDKYKAIVGLIMLLMVELIMENKFSIIGKGKRFMYFLFNILMISICTYVIGMILGVDFINLYEILINHAVKLGLMLVSVIFLYIIPRFKENF